MWSVGTLWLLLQCVQPGGHWAHFECIHWFLSQFKAKCAQHVPEPLIEVSFIMYPAIHSQCAQWVLCNVISMYSQCSLLLPQTLKEIIDYMDGYIVNTLHYERNLNEWLRYMLNTFCSKLWKKPVGTFKMCPVTTWLGTLWKQSQCTHWSHWDQYGGHISKVISMSGSGPMLVTFWATFWKKPLGSFTKYPLGTLLSTVWKNSTCTCQLHAGWIA